MGQTCAVPGFDGDERNSVQPHWATWENDHATQEDNEGVIPEKRFKPLVGADSGIKVEIGLDAVEDESEEEIDSFFEQRKPTFGLHNGIILEKVSADTGRTKQRRGSRDEGDRVRNRDRRRDRRRDRANDRKNDRKNDRSGSRRVRDRERDGKRRKDRGKERQKDKEKDMSGDKDDEHDKDRDTTTTQVRQGSGDDVVSSSESRSTSAVSPRQRRGSRRVRDRERDGKRRKDRGKERQKDKEKDMSGDKDDDKHDKDRDTTTTQVRQDSGDDVVSESRSTSAVSPRQRRAPEANPESHKPLPKKPNLSIDPDTETQPGRTTRTPSRSPSVSVSKGSSVSGSKMGDRDEDKDQKGKKGGHHYKEEEVKEEIDTRQELGPVLSPFDVKPAPSCTTSEVQQAPWGQFQRGNFETVKVRGSNYLEDGKKYPSTRCLYEPVDVAIEVDPSGKSLTHFADNDKAFLQRWIKDHPGTQTPGDSFETRDCKFMVINFLVPAKKPFNLVCTFARNPEAFALAEQHDKRSLNAFEALFHRFLNGSDEFRDSRFKFIPSVLQGPWVVKRAIGNTPAIIGKKLTQSYYIRPDLGYLEIDIDVGSSVLAGRLFSLTKSCAASLVIEFYFVLQGNCKEELPERLLGGMQMIRPDLGMLD